MPQDISDYFTSDSYKREKRLTSLPSKNVVRAGEGGDYILFLISRQKDFQDSLEKAAVVFLLKQLDVLLLFELKEINVLSNDW